MFTAAAALVCSAVLGVAPAVSASAPASRSGLPARPVLPPSDRGGIGLPAATSAATLAIRSTLAVGRSTIRSAPLPVPIAARAPHPVTTGVRTAPAAVHAATTSKTPTTPTTAAPSAPAVVHAASVSATTGSAGGYGCGPALTYLASHAAPGFHFECPGGALGHQAMTCINVPGVCGGTKLITIAVPCPAAYMNEAHNSWVLSGLESGPIDPYGYCH